MKTLDLKFGSVKEMLTKDQLMLINGGVQEQTCTFYWSGAPGCASGTSTVQGTQAGADNNCDNNDCCDNVDCV